MEIKCNECGEDYIIDHKTRRRVVYTCPKCGRSFAIRKRTKKANKQK